ncbi:MAG TPA: peptidoglycan DD-metalloendopeptidase family protein [Woeseiaceae bacterium]|nr:peptidoglycan DD-metalloendopeptidase family protein [Woeseiaceae bacterium]
MKRGLPFLVLLWCLLPAGASPQDDGQVRIKERELQEVRTRISELKARMDRRAAERDRIAGELEAAEVRISETRIHLGELEAEQRYSEEKLGEIEARIAAAEAKLAGETDQLAAQVRAAWMGGSQERIRLLLNQQDPSTLGRVLVYYRYLSDYRSGNIEAVMARLQTLSRLQDEAAAERDRLARLAGARYAELRELSAAQERRQELLASLKARLAEDGAEIERLAAQEADLSRLIAELTAILSDYPITSDQPFQDLKGRLTWPVAGQLLHEFGQPRANGRLQWNGVVLAAPRGREVRSVYHGRVIFADWLDGLGLLVIVDHGGGYLTLYGHNETTLKSTGDWVAPGDAIATVGASGGQPRASLYFEIRRNAKPVNPRDWFTRQPSG